MYTNALPEARRRPCLGRWLALSNGKTLRASARSAAQRSRFHSWRLTPRNQLNEAGISPRNGVTPTRNYLSTLLSAERGASRRTCLRRMNFANSAPVQSRPDARSRPSNGFTCVMARWRACASRCPPVARPSSHGAIQLRAAVFARTTSRVQRITSGYSRNGTSAAAGRADLYTRPNRTSNAMRFRQLMLGCSLVVWCGILGGIVASNHWYCFYWKAPYLIGFNNGSLTIQSSPSIKNGWLVSGWSHSRRRTPVFSWGMTRFGVESKNEFDISLAGWTLLGAGTIPLVFLSRRVWLDRRPPAGHCQECRYDLRGNTSGVCPECGRRS